MRIEFWSSVECNAFLTGVIRELRAAGHDAVHRFQITNGEYRNARGWLRRTWLRVRMYGVYPLQLLASCLWRRRSCVSVVTTNTFFAPLLATLVASRRRKIVHLVYDLFPDALIQAGVVREGSFLGYFGALITRATLRRCDMNVFLGEHLRQHAESRYGPIDHMTVIPVGADGSPFGLPPGGDRVAGGGQSDRTAVPQVEPDELPVTILYCGNMGRMHEVDTLIELLRGSSDRYNEGIKTYGNGRDCDFQKSLPIVDEVPTVATGVINGQEGWGLLHFVFHATGRGYAELRASLSGTGASSELTTLPDLHITFAGELGDAEWQRVMRSAEVALVTVAHGAERIVMPSKVYSAMTAGQAILAICSRDSDLADLVVKHDCGWVVEPGDLNGLRAVLRTIRSNADVLLEKRCNAWQAGHFCYDVKVLASQWQALFSPDMTN